MFNLGPDDHHRPLPYQSRPNMHSSQPTPQHLDLPPLPHHMSTSSSPHHPHPPPPYPQRPAPARHTMTGAVDNGRGGGPGGADHLSRLAAASASASASALHSRAPGELPSAAEFTHMPPSSSSSSSPAAAAAFNVQSSGTPPHRPGGGGASMGGLPSPTRLGLGLHAPPHHGASPQLDPQGKKKKRRVDGELSIEEKRTKTGRACDACRSKKIRCDILPAQTDAVGNGDAQPICAHCKQYNIECTFFLPITETRFKKRRAAADDGSAPSPATKPSSTNGASSKPDKTTGPPTSIPFLLQASVPTRQFEQYDISNHSHWEVSEDPSGQIRVEAALDSGDNDYATRLDRYVLPSPIMTALVNKYFDYDNQFIPVVSRSEFLATRSPHPFLLYAMCACAAVSREYPRHVIARLRGLVNGMIRCNEIMSHAKLEHIQAFLIIAPVGEIHAQPVAPTASACNMRLACTIRMAQDLGFHREPKAQPKTPEEIMALETRRRVWAACVYLDNWYQNGLAVPQLIDIHDCDVLMPSPRDVVPGVDPSKWPLNEGYMCLTQKLKLAVLTGRIVKLLYGPAGMAHTTDEQLENMLAEMSEFRDHIPEALQFKGNDSSFLAGMLHMEFTAAQFLFWRSFIRVTSPPPAHLKLVLDMNRWSELVKASRGAIEWLNLHDKTLDTSFIVPYSATSCALIQYHTWARRRDPVALETLKLIHDVVSRWEEAVKPDQMSIRRKSCETMTLLYEAALKTLPDSDDRTDCESTPGSTTVGAVAAGAKPNQTLPAFPARRAAAVASIEVMPDGGEAGPRFVEYSHAPETDVSLFDEPTEIDMSFLDSIPDSNFDWSGWGEYFETVDRMFPTSQFVDTEDA